MGKPHRIGIVGLGTISRTYLETFASSPRVRVTAVADLDPARAEAVAADLPGARATTVSELVGGGDVDLVVNLTIPAAHAEIALASIAAGVPVFGEKPLAVTLAEGHEILAAAAAAGVGVGSAPDTVLGTGLQTARTAIDAGAIGRPTFALATMVTPGPEPWHPNPEFYYQPGGGPLFDMGPYYLTALVHLLGPVRTVTGAANRSRAERVFGAGPRQGDSFPVAVDSHVTGILEHESGALSTLTTSFDGGLTSAPPIEVHGESGTFVVPDPNRFDGVARVVDLTGLWRDVEVSGGYVGAARGIGALDFLDATGERPARADGRLALHVLDIMSSLIASAGSGRRTDVLSRAERPAPVPLTAADDWRGTGRG